MQLFYHASIADQVRLDEVESQHCIKVLRHKTGDHIHIIDGKGNLYEGIVSNEDHRRCEIKEIKTIKTEPRISRLHIAIAPTKNADRMEWFIEKATEIGVKEVSLIQCQNSERSRVNIDRLNKKATSAIKQNQSLWLPEINPLIPIKDFISIQKVANKFIGFVENKDQAIELSESEIDSNLETIVLIGPEGDFTSDEVQLALKAGYKMVSLGKNVLRTETAGIVACALLGNK